MKGRPTYGQRTVHDVQSRPTEFLDFTSLTRDEFQQLPGCCILTGGDRDLEIALDGLHHLQGLVHI